MNENYKWISNIKKLDFTDKSVAIVGGGRISQEHAKACMKLGIRDICMISKTGNTCSKFCEENKIRIVTGGLENNLTILNNFDLVIIATAISTLLHFAELIISTGQKNILIEKPGSVNSKKLSEFKEKINGKNIKIGYNRLFYPSFHKLMECVKKDGGISSCRFSFTEMIDKIDFKKDISETYQKWGISNSSHVITMILELIGKPKEMFTSQFGSLEWHPSGAIFVGHGISEKNIPFSYHADWNGSGRWGIEIATKDNLYLLSPLEKLFCCPKASFEWKEVMVESSFPEVKTGIAEEIAVMLTKERQEGIESISISKTLDFNQIIETVFGY